MLTRFKPLFFLALLLILALSLSHATLAKEIPRFTFSGDGTLTLNQQSIRFRLEDGSYSEAGLKKIHEIFQAHWNEPTERLSLRFIEILDYLQDQLKGQSYRLKSGYRSPVYNQSLRNKGKLAAQSSMHVEGAAADLILEGVASAKVFEFVKNLNCCGIGWYHSQHFHLDSGPARYWDETSSKTEDKTPQENEKIILQTDNDFYQSGESVSVKFMRVSNYPIGIASDWQLIKLEDQTEKPTSFKIRSEIQGEKSGSDSCKILQDRKQARSIALKLPDKIPPGRYAFKINFCERYDYSKMPAEILSRPFEVVR